LFFICLINICMQIGKGEVGWGGAGLNGGGGGD